MTSKLTTFAVAGAMLAAGAGLSAAQAQGFSYYGGDGYYGGGPAYYDAGYYDGGYYGGGFNPLFAPVAAAAGLVGAAADLATAPFRGWDYGPGYYDAGYYDGGWGGDGYYAAGWGGGGYAYQGYGNNYGPTWVATYKGKHIKGHRMAMRSSKWRAHASMRPMMRGHAHAAVNSRLAQPMSRREAVLQAHAAETRVR